MHDFRPEQSSIVDDTLAHVAWHALVVFPRPVANRT